jgi:EAL domain-containing protein (putative c-di-GMP-specific phosphodiesterase class I)
VIELAAAERCIRVLLVDDHEMLLESLTRLMSEQPDIEVIAVADTAGGAYRAAMHEAPDVAVIDYALPDGVGTDAARQIIAARPETKVIVLSGADTEVARVEAARAGCVGFLDKTKAFGDLTGLIRDAYAGRLAEPTVSAVLPTPEQLVVHYQPIVDLVTTDIVGFEALVRWNHPQRGLVFPDEFIPLAEQTSLITEIDDHVWMQACRQAATWSSRYPDEHARFVNVNVSGRDLGRTNLAARLNAAIEYAALDPHLLVVELTETFLVDDNEVAARTLEEVRTLGVRIALDDFGTGYASLDYLRRLPIDIIKLDKAFTQELPGSRARVFIAAVGQLAQDLGASAEAEGIETFEQLECLRSAGWQLGQGYYFARPQCAAATEALFAPV